MRHVLTTALLASLAVAAPLSAQESGGVRTPEGALLQTDPALHYAPGELTQAQLEANNSDVIGSAGMNVFRRFPPEVTDDMVNFYLNALALRSLSPIQLTSTQQMILTGVGSMQVKLSAGQQGDRLYNLEGGYRGGTGIRFLLLRYPSASVVTQRFTDAGFPAPEFVRREDGGLQALVQDPAGLDIVILVASGAQDHADDGVGVGISVSNIEASRAFYRDFVGLEELPPVPAPVMGLIFYPYRHGETTLMLYELEGENLPADTGSSGVQYVVSDAAMVAARGELRDVTIENPLNMLSGFELTTVWLNDPDGVTNYFAQVGPNPRSTRGDD